MSRILRTSILIMILGLGLGLRVWRIDAIAPSNSDEASYLRHARFMVTFARKTLGRDVPVVDASQTGIWRHVRKADWSAKPCWLHSAFLAGGMGVLGVNDAGGAVVSILFSMATVALCYLVARQFGGDGAGLGAAALLSVSFYWMLYSRGMWAEVDSVFFAVLGVYLLFIARSTQRFLALTTCLAGMSAAGAVLCHYRLLHVMAPLGICLLLLAPPRKWIVGGLSLVAGFAVVVIGAAVTLRLAADAAGPETPFTGLIGALLERYLPGETGVEQKGVQFGNVLAVMYYFLRNHGYTMAVLTGLGGAVAVLNVGYDRRYAAVLCMTLFPLLVLCFQVWVVARAASVMIPFVCVLAGIGLATVWRLGDALIPRWRWIPRAAAVLLTCGAMGENIAKDVRLAGNRIGYQDAAAVLRDGGYDAVMVDPEAELLYGWYAPDLPYQSLRGLYGAEGLHGVTNAAVVFDAQKHHMYPASVAIVDQLEQRVARQGNLVATIPNMTTSWPEFLLDGTQAHTLRGMRQSIRAADQDDITSIRIYEVPQ